MVIVHSYVSLPEGKGFINVISQTLVLWSTHNCSRTFADGEMSCGWKNILKPWKYHRTGQETLAKHKKKKNLELLQQANQNCSFKDEVVTQV